MSNEYTAEDFAQATFAKHENGRKAMRIGGDRGIFRWWVGKYGGATDEDMAAEGWTPAVEVEDWKQRIATLRTAHDEVKNLLKDTADDLRHDLALAREELVGLREENDRLERILQTPLSLKDMQVAWEAAEQADECGEGDVLVTRHSDDNYEVWVSDEVDGIGKKSRILSRAPKREPWADLADVLRAWDAEPADADADGMAKWFHERGVRVTGGDDDE